MFVEVINFVRLRYKSLSLRRIRISVHDLRSSAVRVVRLHRRANPIPKFRRINPPLSRFIRRDYNVCAVRNRIVHFIVTLVYLFFTAAMSIVMTFEETKRNLDFVTLANKR